MEDAGGAAFEQRGVEMIQRVRRDRSDFWARCGSQALLAQSGPFQLRQASVGSAFGMGRSTTARDIVRVERFIILERRSDLRQQDQPDEGETASPVLMDAFMVASEPVIYKRRRAGLGDVLQSDHQQRQSRRLRVKRRARR